MSKSIRQLQQSNENNIPSTNEPSDILILRLENSELPSMKSSSFVNSYVSTLISTTTPSATPSASPTVKPTERTPSTSPSITQSLSPFYLFPMESPSKEPIGGGSLSPSFSFTPTQVPQVASQIPSSYPSVTPTNQPTASPSIKPTQFPSNEPTTFPTSLPTVQPTQIPSFNPSLFPTKIPSTSPSSKPTGIPTFPPSDYPSLIPTRFPIQSIEIAQAVRQNSNLSSSSSVYSATLVGFVVIGSLSVIAIIGILVTRSSLQESEMEDFKDDDCSSISCDDPISLNQLSPQISIVGSFITDDDKSPSKISIKNTRSMESREDSFVIGRPIWSPSDKKSFDEEDGRLKTKESSPIIVGRPVWSPSNTFDETNNDSIPPPPASSPSSPSAIITSIATNFFSNVTKNLKSSQVAGNIGSSMKNIFGDQDTGLSIPADTDFNKESLNPSNTDHNAIDDENVDNSRHDEIPAKESLIDDTKLKSDLNDDNVVAGKAFNRGESLGLNKLSGWIIDNIDDADTRINVGPQSVEVKYDNKSIVSSQKQEDDDNSWGYSSMEDSMKE